MNTDNIPPELKAKFDEIDKTFLNQSRQQLDKDSEKHRQVLEDLNNKTFQLQKDILVMVGTIFGSSIALVTGRNPSNVFIYGEISLLLSICTGLIILHSHLKDREWDYAFFSKMSIDSYLILHSKKIEKFEKDNLDNLVNDYEKIIKKNQSGIIYRLLRIISLETFGTIMNLALLTGITLILLSLIDLSAFWNIIDL